VSAPIHRLSALQRPVVLLTSHQSHFTAAPSGFICFKCHPWRRPFSRSYGANLPSSLTKVLPFALVFSTRLPVSVCGTVTQVSSLRGFSWQQGSATSASGARFRASALPAGFPTGFFAYTLTPIQPFMGWLTSLRPPFTILEWFRNVDRISITYAFRPRLRTD
jgi:hypothetical protein